jgi:outer membrane receptor protein involved in Fe transport
LSGHAAAQSPATAPAASAVQEVVVTARKKSESLIEIPAGITELGPTTLANYNIQDFNDYATKIPNLAFSVGSTTGGLTRARQVAIRGIGGSNTTSFYIDDTPVPDTIDPHLVDINRIEVLKGPQGTLFGENSLGGEVRFITNQPNTEINSLSYMLQGGGTVHGGSADYGGDGVVNQVLIPDRLAIRASIYDTHDAGFVTRVYPNANGVGTSSAPNQGATDYYGAAVSLLYTVNDRFSITVGDLNQTKIDNGLPIAYAPLPSFTPSYTENRVANVPEGLSDRFNVGYVNLKYLGSGFSLTSSTSYYTRDTYDTDDGTEATIATLASAGFTAPAGAAYQWHQFSSTQQITQEARAAFDPIHGISGVVGAYYSYQKVHGGLPAEFSPGLAASGLYPTNLMYSQDVHQTESNTAVFGELYYNIDKFTLTLGGRIYRLGQTSNILGDGFFNGGPSSTGTLSVSQTGALPKAALSYAVTKDANIYVLYSQGFRPGGPNQLLPTACDASLAALGTTRQGVSQYKADTTTNYEAGAKSSIFGGRAYVTFAAFQIDWKNIQQKQNLSGCGFSYTGNAGSARSRGVEGELNGEVLPGLSVRLGAAYDDAVITNSGPSPQPVGSSIFGAPKETATAGFRYVMAKVNGYAPFISGDTSYIGSHVSGTYKATLPLTVPSYDVTNFRAGIDFGSSEVSLFINNAFNTVANLGDINPISFEQTVKINGVKTPLLRVGLLEPLTGGIQFRHGF